MMTQNQQNAMHNNNAFMQNRLNQYTAVNTDAPGYDFDGNMLTNGDWSNTWNGENRLVRAENAVTGAALEFDYDYMGRRIFKKVYQGTVLEKHLVFVYDGYKLIEERDALDGGSLERRYAWQPEVLGRDVPLTVHDAANGCTYYYHTDANKNVTELTDESGAVVAHYEYSPFGTVTHATGSLAADNPFRFSSEYSDAETGLVYYNYRYYSPELGRWISRDPIEELGGVHLYNFVNNNPILLVDHDGLWVRFVSSLISESEARQRAELSRRGINPDNPTDHFSRDAYNYSSSTSWFGIGHFFDDMLPYYLYGNSRDDPTDWKSIWERIAGTYKGPLPRCPKCEKIK